MSGLPETLQAVVCSPSAGTCRVKNCRDCRPQKIHHVDIKNIVDCIPYPTGMSKYESTWAREDAKKRLQKDLEGLGPRFWHKAILDDLMMATAIHDWYLH